MQNLSDSDRAAIEMLFREMSDAWTLHDASRYADCFESDVDYVAFDGTHVHGHAENRALHQRLFAGILRGTRIVGQLEQLRALTPDVAVAHSLGAVLFPWQHDESTKGRASRQTLVLLKRDGRWRAAAFQNTRVRPLPAPAPDSFITRMFRAYATLRVALARCLR